MPQISQWTIRSLEWANQRDYLDRLFAVYPMRNNLKRFLPEPLIHQLQELYDAKDSFALVSLLLKQEVFPIKDSYVAYLKRDPKALSRNPRTLNRLAGMLYEMGFKGIIDNSTVPKETNRQIGPLFKDWLATGTLGCAITQDEAEFINSDKDIIYLHSDAATRQTAETYLGYSRDKGLDFLGKFNNIFILGEAKFLSDFGGHQNAQFNDAIATLQSPLNHSTRRVIKIAILDGVLYIPSRNHIYLRLIQLAKTYPIMSALVLRDFLYSL